MHLFTNLARECTNPYLFFCPYKFILSWKKMLSIDSITTNEICVSYATISPLCRTNWFSEERSPGEPPEDHQFWGRISSVSGIRRLVISPSSSRPTPGWDASVSQRNSALQVFVLSQRRLHHAHFKERFIVGCAPKNSPSLSHEFKNMKVAMYGIQVKIQI